MIRKIDLR